MPRLTNVPHRVKIVDERDLTGKPDERTLLQLKHKHELSLINKRRQIIFKMMTQTKKNQIKMEQQSNQKPLIVQNSSCCHELLERANQIEQNHRDEYRRQRPQTAMVSRTIIPKKNQSLSSTIVSDQSSPTMENLPLPLSTSKPFQDALSIRQIEKTKNIRVLLPTRPMTAPTRVNWVNYC